jgi:hypothetical protein
MAQINRPSECDEQSRTCLSIARTTFADHHPTPTCGRPQIYRGENSEPGENVPQKHIESAIRELSGRRSPGATVTPRYIGTQCQPAACPV